MCLTTKQKNPIILDEDKVVYKLMFAEISGRYYTIVQGVTINTKGLNEAKFVDEEIDSNIKTKQILRGLHLFTNFSAAVGSGYSYSYMAKCIIPKGTRVFYDEFYSEIVAEAYRVVEVYTKDEIDKMDNPDLSK